MPTTERPIGYAVVYRRVKQPAPDLYLHDDGRDSVAPKLCHTSEAKPFKDAEAARAALLATTRPIGYLDGVVVQLVQVVTTLVRAVPLESPVEAG